MDGSLDGGVDGSLDGGEDGDGEGHLGGDGDGFPHGFGLAPLDGGHSGETFVAESAGERTVVRIYAHRGARRGPAAVEIDAAVLRLVRGLLPVPEVLEVRRPDAASGTPGLLVTSYLRGERLDLLMPRLDPAERAALGRRLGRLTARLACMPMVRGGFFVDGDLRIDPWVEAADLVSYVELLRQGSRLGEWADDDYAALLDVAEAGQTLLDRVDRSCLVHSDFNLKNVLVDPATGEITGLLDWEFAHAGAPVSDLGNLLRFDRDPAFSEAVLAAHAELVPDAGEDLLDLARAADLFALTELASRRGENPVTDQADALLRVVARTGDLSAVP